MSVTLLQRNDGPLVRRFRPRAQINEATAALINRISRPREPYAASVETLPLRLAVAEIRLDLPPALPDAVEIGFVLDDGTRLDLSVPQRTLDRLARAVQADLPVLPPEPVGALLIELALAPLLGAAERATGRSIRIESIGHAAPRAGAMTLMLNGDLAGESFRAMLGLGLPPETMLPPGLEAVVGLIERCPARTASVSALPVVLAFVAGRAELSLRQLHSLQIGDAVLPDLWLPSGGEILVALGDDQAATATTDRHTSTLKTPFRPTAKTAAAARGIAGMAQDTTAEKLPPDANTDESGLDAVSVTLAFELGRRSLGIGELKGIGAGHVFDLGLDPEQPVDLVANGTKIGRGEIVEIGERIGIRVVRLFGQG
jgi:type III secretion protein Q